MNLLDNLTYFLKPGLAIVLIPFFFACDDPSELGLELNRDDAKVVVTDTTLILPTSTIYIDSLRTDGGVSPSGAAKGYSYTAFGRYQSNIYGEVVATSNSSYRIGNGVYPSDTLAFEEAYIVTAISNVRTSSPQSTEQFLVYESSDTIFSEGIYLQNRMLTKAGDSIADHTISFDAEIDSIINIPLHTSFGEELFEVLVKSSDSTSNPGFRAYFDSLLKNNIRFKPLIIQAGASNKALMNLNMRDDTTGIYVKMRSPTTQSTYLYQYKFSSGIRYTSIERDRTNALLSDLNNDYDVSSATSDDTYLDMLAGIHTKIDLSPLINLYETQPNLIFNSVNFTLNANANNSSYIDQIPQLTFYFIKGDGTINATGVQLGDIRNNVLLTENSYTSANVAILPMAYNTDSIRYSGNITLFSQYLGDTFNEETDQYLTRELVILSPQGIGLGQTSFPKGGVKLTIYYSSLKE